MIFFYLVKEWNTQTEVTPCLCFQPCRDFKVNVSFLRPSYPLIHRDQKDRCGRGREER